MQRTLLLVTLMVCTFAAQAAAAEEAAITVKGVTVRFDAATRTLQVSDREAGTVLDRIAVKATVGGRVAASDDKALRFTTSVAGGELAVALDKAFTLKAAVREGAVEIRAEGDLQGPALLSGRAALGAGAIIARLQDEAKTDKSVLVTTLGPAQVPGALSLFDRERDLAMTVGPADRAQWRRGEGWEVRSSAPAGQPLLTVRLAPRYYRDTLGIKFYAPISKVSRWPTAPVVAMTWYGIAAMHGRPAQTMERLRKEIDWVAGHLLPYAGPNLIFQLDDNYAQTDDRAMRGLSDYIRSKGLVPGLWFTPFTVAPKAEAEKHPEWFLHDREGKLIPTFGGVNWGGDFTLNATRPPAVEAWFGMFWHKVSETWNYEFFKIDGQPEVAAAYAKSADGGGLDGYRRGLEIGRAAIGPEKFINACWGTPLEAIGRVNGSRTGGDTGYDPHAIGVVLEWNFLNNIAWYSDPDAAADLYKATVERARLNAQARVLTGQQFLTDDRWTEVPPAIRRVWQQSFPMLDIRPANLYPIKEWRKYDMFDLRIARPWGTWDVAGLFNYDGRPAARVLDLARLPLEAEEVHVFDFWGSAYVGRFRRDAKIPLAMAAWEGKLFSLTPAVGERPVLLSTSRHASQGGLDLERLSWREDGARWIASGRSSHLVKGDPYELVFAGGRYVAAAVKSAAGKGSTRRSAGAARAVIVPEKSGEAEWEVTLEPIAEPMIDVLPASVDLPAGATGEIEIQSLGPAPARFKLEASDPRVHLAPEKGEIGPWPAKTKIAVSADTAGLELGKVLTATVAAAVEGGKGAPPKIDVRVHAPRPENLAAKAKAKASSVWDAGYEPEKAVDADPATRWNSRKGDENGCWIELEWEKPLAFDRVVIDECTDWGERIQAWRLLAGDADLKEISRGTTMGRQRAVDLPKTIEARRLRLVIEKSTDTPTISEIEVQRVKGK
ncbi:MAG: discoidin domain-containing protein [Planctomycetota bacterium]|nr:discoidin domain-containing protein [Planctomycetota bacterium]